MSRRPLVSSAHETTATNGTTYLRNSRFRIHGSSQRLSATTARAYPRRASADDVVGARHQGGRQAQLEGGGRPEIDDELEARWALHGDVGGAGAAQQAIHRRRGAAEGVGEARPPRQQAAGVGVADEGARRRELAADRALG